MNAAATKPFGLTKASSTNCLAVGLARGLEEDEPLSGDRFSMTSPA